MTLFAIVVTNDNDIEAMTGIIEQLYKETDRCQVSKNLWFVNCERATPKDVYDFLTDDKLKTSISAFLIIPVKSYYGMQKRIVWDWLVARGG